MPLPLHILADPLSTLGNSVSLLTTGATCATDIRWHLAYSFAVLLVYPHGSSTLIVGGSVDAATSYLALLNLINFRDITSSHVSESALDFNTEMRNDSI